MAYSDNNHPRFTTIGDFISHVGKEVVQLCLQVLLICDQLFDYAILWTAKLLMSVMEKGS